MEQNNKPAMPESLKDLALPAGVFLVLTILNALGLTDPLIGRLMRNSPSELNLALSFALVGVSLPAIGRLIVEIAGRPQPEANPKPADTTAVESGNLAEAPSTSGAQITDAAPRTDAHEKTTWPEQLLQPLTQLKQLFRRRGR